MKLTAALQLTGISPEWVGAFVSHPEDFRNFAKRMFRVVSPAIQPDVAAHISLSQHAGNINQAYQTLIKATDEALIPALREYADTNALPSRELVTLFASTKSERDTLKEEKERLTARVAQLEAAKPPPALDVKLLYELLLTPQRTFTEYGKSYGELLDLDNIRGQHFHTSIGAVTTERALKTGCKVAGCNLFYVEPSGRVYSEGISIEVPVEANITEVRRLVYDVIHSSVKAGDKLAHFNGTAIGFVNTDHLSDLGRDGYGSQVFPDYTPLTEGYTRNKVASAVSFLEDSVRALETKTRFFPGALTACNSLQEADDTRPLVALVTYHSCKQEDADFGGASSVEYSVIYIEDFVRVEPEKGKGKRK